MTQSDISLAFAKKEFKDIGALSLNLIKERERAGKKDDIWESLIKINQKAHEGHDNLQKIFLT